MNLGGAHARSSRGTSSLLDNSGHTGVGEFTAAKKIRKTLEDAITGGGKNAG